MTLENNSGFTILVLLITISFLTYILPFGEKLVSLTLLVFIIAHFIRLHITGSSNSLGSSSDSMKSEVLLFYFMKDLLNIALAIGALVLVTTDPYKFCESENFSLANPNSIFYSSVLVLLRLFKKTLNMNYIVSSIVM